MLIYCVKCKTKTKTIEEMVSMSKNNKYMIKGKCLNCNISKQQFVTAEQAESFQCTNEEEVGRCE